jgi:hypothetical protein
MEWGVVVLNALDGAFARSVGRIRVRVPFAVCKAYSSSYGPAGHMVALEAKRFMGASLLRHAPPAREGGGVSCGVLQEHVGAFRRVVPACDDASALDIVLMFSMAMGVIRAIGRPDGVSRTHEPSARSALNLSYGHIRNREAPKS